MEESRRSPVDPGRGGRTAAGRPGLKPRIAVAGFFLLYAASAARALFGYAGQKLLPAAYGLLVGFLALSPTPHLLAPRFRPYPTVYLALQSALVAALILLPPHPDFIATLYICLTMQAMSLFASREGFRWTAVFSLLIPASLAAAFGPGEGLTYAPSPIAGCVLVALYMNAVRKAEDEKNRSQALFAELQKYTARAKEYAAAEERNRLARELHDSVTQKLFSMTLTAEAARLLHEREPGRVAALLERIKELARESLAEMRALLQKLSRETGTEEGLVAALRRQVEERRRDGLEVKLVVEGEPDLPGRVEEALFRIVQEALNNVAKHSGAPSARVCLGMRGKTVALLVEDGGRGFRPAEAAAEAQGRGAGAPAHLGLAGMRERVRSLGGTIAIDSEPGRGTRLRVEVPAARERPPGEVKDDRQSR